ARSCAHRRGRHRRDSRGGGSAGRPSAALGLGGSPDERGARGGTGDVAPSVPARVVVGGADADRAQRAGGDSGQPARGGGRRSERLVPDSRAARGGGAARGSL